MVTRDEVSHSHLMALGFERLLTRVALLGETGSLFILPLDFNSCTMNHVNCPQGIKIFAQLLDNFLLLWHFAVFLLTVICDVH